MRSPSSPGALGVEHERAVLALFVAQVQLPACRDRCRPDFDAALAGEQPLEQFANRLSHCLAERTQEPACATLLRLIDGVSLPQELRDEATALRTQLSAEVGDATTFGRRVRQLAALIDALPSQLQREKDAVAAQLSGLGDRLHALHRVLNQATDIGTVAEQETAALDQAVASEVHGLEAEYDAGTLGDRLHARLDAIVGLVHRYREREVQRFAGLRVQNSTLHDRVRVLENAIAQLQANLSAQRARVVTDPLTGLHNRFAYDERLAHELARWQRYRTPFSLLLCDIDHFKKVNDRHGHQAGDEVLKKVAKLLASTLRQSDFIARYGGEEFVVLLPGTRTNHAAAVGEKLRQRVTGATIDLGTTTLGVTISCGHATLDQASAPPDTPLFERADAALYSAKYSGRNRVCAG